MSFRVYVLIIILISNSESIFSQTELDSLASVQQPSDLVRELLHLGPRRYDSLRILKHDFKAFMRHGSSISDGKKYFLGRKQLDPVKDSLNYRIMEFVYDRYNGDSTNAIVLLTKSQELDEIFYFFGEGKIGAYKRYYRNGQMKCCGHYDKWYRRTGTWLYYSENGKLHKSKSYHNKQLVIPGGSPSQVPLK